jgi:ubiquinone/menaquinone biosynthesis C-methylase UbiE
MLKTRQLKKIRQATFRSSYGLDKDLIKEAEKHPTDGIYQTIINRSSHLIYRYLSEFVRETMLQQTGHKPQQIKVLDWGGGKGYVTYFLRQLGLDATCYEMEEFPHRAIWEAFDLPAVTGSGTALPFDDGSFDAVISFGVLEHVPYDYESLKEINRVLKKDGLFFCFNLPNRYGYLHHLSHWRGIVYHDRLYGRRETQNLLKRAGLNTIGQPWYRQLLPKNSRSYNKPGVVETCDLVLTKYTPLRYFATSVEFVARKQFAYLSDH